MHFQLPLKCVHEHVLAMVEAQTTWSHTSAPESSLPIQTLQDSNYFSLVKQIISKSNGWNAISMKCQLHDKFRAERMSSEITPVTLVSNPHHLYQHLSVPTPSN